MSFSEMSLLKRLMSGVAVAALAVTLAACSDEKKETASAPETTPAATDSAETKPAEPAVTKPADTATATTTAPAATETAQAPAAETAPAAPAAKPAHASFSAPGFRETLWFKKGELDAQLAQAEEPSLEAPLSEGPKGVPEDERPLSERYADDGSLSREEAKQYSLRTGRTEFNMPASNAWSASARRRWCATA